MLTHLKSNFSFLLVLTLLLGSCTDSPHETKIIGFTMGTSYSVQLTDSHSDIQKDALKQKITQRLDTINFLMSTYDKTSQLSEFNQSREIGWHAVDRELAELVTLALQVSEFSNGAFDITIGPLVNLWGFGPSETAFKFPSEVEIAIALKSVGYQHLQARLEPPALNKNRVDLYVDLSAIAKGYAVDEIAKILDDNSIENYMVEIGGEVKGKGVAPHGQPWRIGIETPKAQRGKIEEIISLNNVGVATSGDYRNFIEHEGKRFSHTIDPRTGYPVSHNLGSVTVLNESTAIADAWATAFLVMGPAQTHRISNKNKIAALLLAHDNGQSKSTASDVMKTFLVDH